MRIKSHIVKAVEEVDYKVRYDTEVKKILSDPQILAWILKYTVKEFAEYPITEIIPCIEGEAEVSTHAVHPGYYTVPIEGEATEATETAAQRVTYDIRFKVRVPEQGLAGMIINVEAQNKFYENYDLVTRGVFYCARMLSGQIHNEESAEEYNHLQKVYSIWICMNAPLNSEYTITCYHMQREEVYGHMASNVNQRYDLMEMVMVCLGRSENKEKGTQLHKLLTKILSEELTPQEKIRVMIKEYDIVATVELEGGLAKMCNLSEYIEEKYLQQGMQIGMGQGIEQGIEQGLAALVKSLSVFIHGEEELYQAVIKNEIYQNFSREAVLKYTKK